MVWSINVVYSSCWCFNNLYHVNSYKYGFSQLISHIFTSSNNFSKNFSEQFISFWLNVIQNTVEILIMHSAGSPTSLCIMRCYALSDLILSVKGHFVPGRSYALCDFMHYENFNCSAKSSIYGSWMVPHLVWQNWKSMSRAILGPDRTAYVTVTSADSRSHQGLTYY